MTLLVTGLLVLFSETPLAQERWMYRYDGSDGFWDEVNSIVVGADGNLYAAGWTTETGSIGSSYAFTVVGLDTSGAERWVYRHDDGPGLDLDVAHSIIMGSDGNLYVAGRSYSGIPTGGDFTVVSLDTSGAERWVYRYGDPGSSWDEARSIVMGSDGYLYAAGWSCAIGTNRDFTVVSVDTSGTERWVYRYEGPGNSWDEAQSIVIGSDGYLYAAGWSSGIGSDRDFTVVSLDTKGAERWIYRFNGTADSADVANSIAAGSDGNIYAAGWVHGSGTWDDFTVVSLDTSGAERWVYRYNPPGNGQDEAFSIVAGWDSNLYVAGRSYCGFPTGVDFTVVSLDTSGAERWVYLYDGPRFEGSDEAKSIAMGPEGNICVAGWSSGTSTDEDFTVISLTAMGAERWVYRYGCPPDILECANTIATGPDGNIYAAGRTCNHWDYWDFTVVSLAPGGVIDAAVVGLDSPPDTVLVDSAYGVKATVRNFGDLVATFDAVAAIDGYLDTVRVQYLTPGTSTQVDFKDWQVPSSDSTTHSMTICVYAVGDVDTTNDCMQKSVFAREGVAPVILSAEASDNVSPVPGIDADDYVLLRFDELTNRPPIDALNINSVLSLSGGHSWLDGFGDIGAARWNPLGDMLMIELSVIVNPPTVAVGDTIIPDGATITDEWGNAAVSPVVIKGSFSPPGIGEGVRLSLPMAFALSQNQPNPFTRLTTITYAIPANGGAPESHVNLAIYDLTGRLVETLVNETQQPGMHQVQWSRKRNPSGVYFYRINAGSFTETRKMVVVD